MFQRHPATATRRRSGASPVDRLDHLLPLGCRPPGGGRQRPLGYGLVQVMEVAPGVPVPMKPNAVDALAVREPFHATLRAVAVDPLVVSAPLGLIADAFALDQRFTSARAKKDLGWKPLHDDPLAVLAGL